MKLNRITKRALWIGGAIGLLNVIITNIFVSNRPIGASTSYPYISGLLFDLQSSTYFKVIDIAGTWGCGLCSEALLALCVSLFGLKNSRCMPSLIYGENIKVNLLQKD